MEKARVTYAKQRKGRCLAYRNNGRAPQVRNNHNYRQHRSHSNLFKLNYTLYNQLIRMTVEFVGEFRKVGNSLSVIIPKNIAEALMIKEGNSGRVWISTIDEKALKEQDLRNLHEYTGENGTIFLKGREVGKVDKIYFNETRIKVGYGPDFNMNLEDKTIIKGVLCGHLMKSKLIDIFGDYIPNYFFEFDVEIEAKNKKNQVFMVKLAGIAYEGSKGLVLDYYPFGYCGLKTEPVLKPSA